MKKLILFLLGGGCLFAAQTGAQAQMLINGAGATFPYPDLLEVVRRIRQGGPVGPLQLPIHRLRRRAKANHRPDRGLRRFRRPDER